MASTVESQNYVKKALGVTLTQKRATVRMHAVSSHGTASMPGVINPASKLCRPSRRQSESAR